MPSLVHITDLHLDGFPAALDQAIERVGAPAPDLFLIGGDNGGREGIRTTVAVLRYHYGPVPIAWVMGNHDLWHRPIESLWKAEAAADAVYLEVENLETDFCTVVGTYGHYDHSGGDPTIPEESYESYQYGPLGWNDRYIDRQGQTNREIALQVATRFQQRYQRAIERPLPVVVLLHCLPFVELNAWPRNFYGAYGTNSHIGRILIDCDRKPSVLFCGHTHRPIRSDRFRYPMINTGSDYGNVRITRWDL